MNSYLRQIIEYSAEVSEALKDGNKPIVALESTIISHGMPYPENYKCATDLENIVRSNGAVPATIAIINGKIKIGLSNDDLLYFAQDKHIAKVSTRDIAFIIAKKANGATTVAATSLLASLAGIKIFVTGGIGGVHRGYEETMDVSNDLVELGRIPICVISAGAKSILDIPRTLEYLETEGVLVMGYKTDDFPAFFQRKSGLKCQFAEDEKFIGEVLKTHFDVLNLQRGVLVGNPLKPEDEIEGEEIEKMTVQALNEAKTQNISGRDVTPFILKRVAELTSKTSLAVNIKLVYNNADVGSKIAVAYHQAKQGLSSN